MAGLFSYGMISTILLVTSAYSYILEETKAAHTKIAGDHITIVCDHGTLDSVPPLPSNTNFKSIELQHCDLPVAQYEVALEKIGIRANIENLRIIGEDAVLPNPDDFQGLTVRFPVELETNDTTIGGCSNIKQVTVMSWNNKNIKSGFFQTCSNMRSLHLESLGYMNFDDMNRVLNLVLMYKPDASHYKVTLESLTIRRCGVTVIYPEFFASVENLKSLDLSHNNLRRLNDIAFIRLKNLQKLDLSYNDLNNGSNIFEALELVQRTLRNLTLDYNKFSICDLIPSSYDDLSALEHLSLRGVGSDYICTRTRAYSLRHLDLRDNNYTQLMFRYLPLTQSESLVVDFRNNPISATEYSEPSAIKHNNVKLEIWTDGPITLDCECDGYNMGQPSNVKIPSGLLCEDGTWFLPDDYRQTKCKELNGQCVQCECMQRTNQLVDAFCNFVGGNDVFHIPKLRSLHAAHSRVDRLPESLPDSLLNIDVSFSRIKYISEKSLEAVFKVKERRIWLAGNPLVVDQRTAALVKEHSDQVADYGFVETEDGKLFKNYIHDIEEPQNKNIDHNTIPPYAPNSKRYLNKEEEETVTTNLREFTSTISYPAENSDIVPEINTTYVDKDTVTTNIPLFSYPEEKYYEHTAITKQDHIPYSDSKTYEDTVTTNIPQLPYSEEGYYEHTAVKKQDHIPYPDSKTYGDTVANNKQQFSYSEHRSYGLPGLPLQHEYKQHYNQNSLMDTVNTNTPKDNKNRTNIEHRSYGLPGLPLQHEYKQHYNQNSLMDTVNTNTPKDNKNRTNIDHRSYGLPGLPLQHEYKQDYVQNSLMDTVNTNTPKDNKNPTNIEPQIDIDKSFSSTVTVLIIAIVVTVAILIVSLVFRKKQQSKHTPVKNSEGLYEETINL